MRGSAFTYRLILSFLLTLGLGIIYPCAAQRINFSTWTGSDDIRITSIQALPELNFNQKQKVIVKGHLVSIDLVDHQAAAFRIEAPENFDVTVEISAPSSLNLIDDPTKTTPFAIRIAYNNQQPVNEVIGKIGAVELPLGFTNVTFPINRRLSGPPGPPPTPLSGTETRTKVSAYLYVYGSFGPVGGVPAGNYTGDISITVNLTTNE